MADFLSASISPVSKLKAEALLLGIKNGAPRAMTRALNKVAAKARTAGDKEIRKDIRLSSTYVKERLKGPAQAIGNKATFTKQQAKVSAPSRPLVLAHFINNKRTLVMQVGARYLPVIEVKVKPKGSYKTIKDAFLIRLKRGTASGDLYGIFVREGGRLKHLYGPSLSQVWASEKDVILPAMNQELAIQFDKEIDGVLRQFG